MFGSLVIFFPTHHEGGALSLISVYTNFFLVLVQACTSLYQLVKAVKGQKLQGQQAMSEIRQVCSTQGSTRLQD
jgi:hypothetical protein